MRVIDGFVRTCSQSYYIVLWSCFGWCY